MKKTYEKGKISVIIPCYNQGRFLGEAVDSVLNQTYQNLEIIIINDGSTDRYTNKLLENYKREKTKVYHTKNQGLASTRNYGYSLSNGEFIQFLDADDFIDFKKFERQIEIFKKNRDIGVCYCNYRYYYDNGKKYVDNTTDLKISDNPFRDFVYRWQRGLSIPIHCALFKSKIWEKRAPFVENFKAVEDWIMWCNIAKNNKLEFIDENLATYRIQDSNMTKDKEFMFYWAAMAISYIRSNLIIGKEREFYDREQQKYLRILADLFYFNDYKSQILEKDRMIQEKESVIIDKERIIQNKESVIIDKEKIIQNKESVIKDKEDIIREQIDIINLYENSISYRIGRLLTYVPRKLRDLLK